MRSMLDGGLDHVRRVALAVVVDPLELRARVLRVLREVEVAAVRDSLELLPADRVEVLDVARAARVVRALALRRARARGGCSPRRPRSRYQPSRCSIQYSYHFVASAGGTKNSISICSNSRTRKRKLPGRDLVAERLADLRDAERRLAPRELGDVLEVDEDALRGLGAEVRGRALVLERADVRLEHEVELARLGEVAVGRLAGPLARLAAAAARARAGRRGSGACTCGSRRAGR